MVNFITHIENQKIPFFSYNEKIIISDDTPISTFNKLIDIPSNLVFNAETDLSFSKLIEIPDNTEFANNGSLDLSSVQKIGKNVVFRNVGNVILSSLTFLPEDVQFKNVGSLDLSSLEDLSVNEFENIGDIVLNNLKDQSQYKGIQFIPQILDTTTCAMLTHSKSFMYRNNLMILYKFFFLRGGAPSTFQRGILFMDASSNIAIMENTVEQALGLYFYDDEDIENSKPMDTIKISMIISELSSAKWTKISFS